MAQLPTIDDLRPWLDAEAARSGGPGGQNVNKVNTRITLLFDLANCPLYTAEQKERIGRRLAKRIGADGRVRVMSQQSRSQLANRRSAETRLVELLTAALHVATVRRATSPTAGSRRRRLTAKRQRSETKRLRQGRGERQ